jgi:hypothetical protein
VELVVKRRNMPRPRNRRQTQMPPIVAGLRSRRDDNMIVCLLWSFWVVTGCTGYLGSKPCVLLFDDRAISS